MTFAFRIVKEQHADSAFSGEGAARFGGRWNSRGVRVVYASQSLSLAALETLVHLSPPVSFKYVAFRLEFDDELIERISLTTLPSDWRIEPPPPSTRTIGDEWVRSARSAVLGLPSTLIPAERNFLINPAHRDFRRVSVDKAEPFAFDPRVLRP